MYTDDYMTYLKKEKRMSENTRAAYGRDLAEFVAFEGARGMTDLLGVTSTEIIAFLHHLHICHWIFGDQFFSVKIRLR